jgi:hypothetical protein
MLARMTWGQVFRGNVLDRTPDPALQLVAADALAVTRAAWAAVTLQVNSVLVCRANQSMPSRLGISYGWPRTGSFCELVVAQEKPLEIADASIDVRGGADVRRRHGVLSYVGAPVRVGDVVVGSLCVHDTKPRHYDVDLVERLAARVSTRLTALAEQPAATMRLFDMAIEPAFAQIRNTATPLNVDLANARDLIDGLEVRTNARNAIGEVHTALDGITRTVRQLLEQFAALQVLVQSSGRSHVQDIVRASTTLAAHHTGLVGGVRWRVPQPDRTILSPTPTSVALLSATLSLLAQGLHAKKRSSGIIASVNDAESSVTFTFQSALGGDLLEVYSSKLQTLVEANDVYVASGADSVFVSLPAS